LNLKSLREDIPKEVEGIYDAEKYAKSQKYTRTNIKFSLFNSAFSFIVILFMLFVKGFALIDKYAVSLVGDHLIKTALIFFLILFLLNEIITLPFEIYDTFVIEKKFGFNKSTPKIFISDKIKSIAIGIVIGGIILGLLIYFYQLTTNMFWIYAWIAISIISIFMTMFYSNLIVPLFNKQTPLPQGELRDAIENFSKKVGFKLKDIYVINASKRSTKANAYFTGLGPKKRIVLYDTLIEQLTTDEIVAVLAHEIGHFKKKHTSKSIIISLVNTGIILYIFSLVVKYPQISEALGTNGVRFHVALIAFALLYSPISLITGLGMNIFSRKNEYQADNFAKQNGLAEALISGLKKLSANSLSNLTPHPAYVFVHYSHPSLIDRIKNLQS
jgi:STE24 endopeptidase